MQQLQKQLIRGSSSLSFCRPIISCDTQFKGFKSRAVHLNVHNRQNSSWVCRAASSITWNNGACEASPLHRQVLEAAGVATTFGEQYDPKAIDTCLSEALKDFDKEARRYKISRDGVITETTFPASNPPNRYPTFLNSDCDFRDGNAKTVYEVNNALIVHTRNAAREPFYPRLEVLPMNSYNIGHKPRGFFTALGGMWIEFDYNQIMSHVSRTGMLAESYEQPISAKKLQEVINVSVSPDMFTWDVSTVPKSRKILVVDCKQQWDAVEAAFGVPGEPYLNPLDWDRLAESYAGIDVRVGETNKLPDGPVWVMGWDVIGSCIWDLAAVGAEMEVRTCGTTGDAAYAWIKAQEAKATTVKVLLDNSNGETNAEEEREAFLRSSFTMTTRFMQWKNRKGKAYKDPAISALKEFSQDHPMLESLMSVFEAVADAKANNPSSNSGSSDEDDLSAALNKIGSTNDPFLMQLLEAMEAMESAKKSNRDRE